MGYEGTYSLGVNTAFRVDPEIRARFEQPEIKPLTYAEPTPAKDEPGQGNRAPASGAGHPPANLTSQQSNAVATPKPGTPTPASSGYPTEVPLDIRLNGNAKVETLTWTDAAGKRQSAVLSSVDGQGRAAYRMVIGITKDHKPQLGEPQTVAQLGPMKDAKTSERPYVGPHSLMGIVEGMYGSQEGADAAKAATPAAPVAAANQPKDAENVKFRVFERHGKPVVGLLSDKPGPGNKPQYQEIIGLKGGKPVFKKDLVPEDKMGKPTTELKEMPLNGNEGLVARLKASGMKDAPLSATPGGPARAPHAARQRESAQDKAVALAKQKDAEAARQAEAAAKAREAELAKNSVVVDPEKEVGLLKFQKDGKDFVAMQAGEFKGDDTNFMLFTPKDKELKKLGKGSLSPVATDDTGKTNQINYGGLRRGLGDPVGLVLADAETHATRQEKFTGFNKDGAMTYKKPAPGTEKTETSKAPEPKPEDERWWNNSYSVADFKADFGAAVHRFLKGTAEVVVAMFSNDEDEPDSTAPKNGVASGGGSNSSSQPKDTVVSNTRATPTQRQSEPTPAG